MTRLEYFELAKQAKLKYEAEVNRTSDILNKFTKGEMGLVPDHIKASSEFQAAKKDYENAFNDLRNFNSNYVKQFKVELKEERNKKKD